MGPVKTFLNLQMSILTSLPPSQVSAQAPNNKWLLLTVLSVMMPENKQKSINNNLLRKNEFLNETDMKVGCSKWHLRAWREKEVAAAWVGEETRGMPNKVWSKGMRIWLLGPACCFPMQRCKVIGRLQFTPSKHTHTYTQIQRKKIPHQTLSWVGLNNKAAPAQVVYPDTKAIPHIN